MCCARCRGNPRELITTGNVTCKAPVRERGHAQPKRRTRIPQGPIDYPGTDFTCDFVVANDLWSRGTQLVLLMTHVAALMAGSAYAMGVLSMLCASLVLLASFSKGVTMPVKRPIEVLIVVGERSYGIYLAHLAAIYITKEIMLRLITNGALHPTLAMLMTISTFLFFLVIFMEFSFRCIEQPLRQYGALVYRRVLEKTQPSPSTITH
jgi:peptidoglycan/LPS O-acetylase OafA/YrhL